MTKPRAVITGTHGNIGFALAVKFMEEGYEVHGIDVLKPPSNRNEYVHYMANIVNEINIPFIDDVEVLINCAGTFNEDGTGRYDTSVNLFGAITVTERFALHKDQTKIRSVLNLGALSAITGDEPARYVCSKGGIIAYTAYTARALLEKGGEVVATCNCISPGWVSTFQNRREKKASAPEISVEDIVSWAWFLTTQQTCATGQNFVLDKGQLVAGDIYGMR